MSGFDSDERKTHTHASASGDLLDAASGLSPGKETLISQVVPCAPSGGEVAASSGIAVPFVGASVQRKESSDVDRSATRAAWSIDSPPEVEDSRATLEITDGPSGQRGLLSPEQIEHARVRNGRRWHDWHRRGLDERVFADVRPDSVEFALAVARFQASTRGALKVDGIAGPETWAKKGVAPKGTGPSTDRAEPHDDERSTLPIQTKAAGTATKSPEETQQIAARGVAGPGETMPFLGELQESFGPAGGALRDARAHIGGDAAAAAGQIGAHAFATGHDVALPEHPDKGLVAHEAAHVVQQAGGVHPSGGVGAAGDPLEQQADAVAEAVVAGKSAAPILASSVGGSGGATSVQRQGAPDAQPRRPSWLPPEPEKPEPAFTYEGVHEAKIFDAIKARFSSLSLPPPHEHMVWVGGGAAMATGFEQALIAVRGGDANLEVQLPELLYPIDPWRIIDQHRQLATGRPGETIDGQPATGTMVWNPLVGHALAIEFEGHLRESLTRMGFRYAAQAEEMAKGHENEVQLGLLVTSHPFDRIVARLLTNKDVVRYVPPGGHSHGHGHDKKPRDTDAPTAFKNGIRLVRLEWQGDRDPALWNWVRAVDPPDATVEEVSASLFERGNGETNSQYAYGLTAAAPFFRVPPKWAYSMPGAHAHLPKDVNYDEGANDHSALDLAGSAIADEAAVAQAAAHQKLDKHGVPVPADRAQLFHTLEQSEAQLKLVKDRLDGDLWERVLPALNWVIEKRKVISYTAPQLVQPWAPIIEGQKTILFDATGELLEVLDAARSSGVKPEEPEGKPFRDVLEAYATAMGESNLIDTASTQLQAARRLKAMLPLRLLDMSMRESRAATQEMREVVPADAQLGDMSPRGGAQAEQQGLERGEIDLRATMVAGGDVDPTSVEALAVAASEGAFVDRMTTLTYKLELLKNAAWDADEGGIAKLANIFNGDIKQLPMTLIRVQEGARTISQAMQKRSADVGTKIDPKWGAQQVTAFVIEERKAAVAEAHAALEQLREREHLDTLFQTAIETIRSAQTRTLILEVALLIGVSVAGGVVGTLVGGAVRGAILADAAVDTAGFARTASVARTLGTAANVATDAAVNAVGQSAIFGDDVSSSFVDNLLTNVAVLAALKPIHAATESWGKIEEDAVGAWQKTAAYGKFVLGKGAVLSADVITSMAVGYAVQRVRHGEQPASDDVLLQWVLQGASMAVGHFINGRLQGMHERLGKLAEVDAHFAGRVRAQEAMAAKLEKAPNAEAALMLLEDHTELLRMEKELLSDDAVVARLGLDAQQVEALRAGNAHAIADTRGPAYQLLQLRFEGLEPVAAGEGVWSGTREQIEGSIAKAGDEATVVSHDEQNRRWEIMLSGRPVTFVETAAPPSASAPAHGAHAGAADAGHAGARPSGAHASELRRDFDPKWLSEGQERAAEWQIHALETDPRAASLMSDPEFQQWCSRWLSQPGGPFAGDGHTVYPEGAPASVRVQIDEVVKKGNIKLATRANEIVERIKDEFPGMPLDPDSAEWKANRSELKAMLGEDAIESFEDTTRQRRGDPGRAQIDTRIDGLVDPSALDVVTNKFPGAQVYVTGSAAQTTKAVETVTDLDVFVVVAENTPPAARIEMEERAGRFPVKRPSVDGHPAGELEVDAKVMTPSEFAGWNLAAAETTTRTPMRFARVDAPTSGQPLGTGETGADLHNHIMGVPATDYFVAKAGGGSAVQLLESSWELVNDSKTWKNGKRPVTPELQQELANAVADVRNEKGKVPPEALEARARRAMDKVLAASEHVAFDHTYDLRDLLVQKYIDPSGSYRNFAADAIEDLHDQGVTYSEQSVSLKKLAERFDEATMREVHAKLAAEGKDSDLRFLAMLPTETVLSAAKPGAEPFKKMLDTLRTLLARGDVAGVDIAGPESHLFTRAGMENLRSLLAVMKDMSAMRGRPLVLRPHVGEGYEGERSGEHIQVARRNLDEILDVIEGAGYRGPSEGVIIRFGHAAHATQGQIKRMQRLGIVVEANIGSNLATGSVVNADEHPLLYNLYYGTRTILSTDGQGVMGTNLQVEYQRAATLIEEFRAGQTSLRIAGKVVTYGELPPDVQKRFSIEALAEWAKEYTADVHSADARDRARVAPGSTTGTAPRTEPQ